MKKICYFIFIVTLTTFSASYASSDSHEKAASDLLDVMHLNELLSQTMDSMLQLQLKQNPQLKPFSDTIKQFLNKYMSGDSLRDDVVKLYTETFTEQELIKITDFYKTPTGQKALEVTPELSAKIAAIGQKRVGENMPELKKMIAEEAERIKKLQNQ